MLRVVFLCCSAAALNSPVRSHHFNVGMMGLSCVDVGCSTGGFTDCLLKRGASHVISVDVGRAQFDWSLRQDERVVLLERTNMVDLPSLGYESCCDLAVCDVSFTSIATVLPSVLSVLTPFGRFLTLVKPQFEAPSHLVGEGGVVRDPSVHQDVLAWAIHTQILVCILLMYCASHNWR